MDDYISRQAFIEDIKTEILNLSMDGMKGTHRPHDELYGFIERIEEQPSADVCPVVRGRWVEKDDDLYCSNCNHLIPDCAGNATNISVKDNKFCYYCGAMMMEE